MEKFQQNLQEMVTIIESNFFLSREYKKLFQNNQEIQKLVNDKKFQELAEKLVLFIISVNKKSEQSSLQQRLAQTQQLISNYKAQIMAPQMVQSQLRQSVTPLDENTLQIKTGGFKSNPITPRDIPQNNIHLNQQCIERRLKSNQLESQKQNNKQMFKSSSQQRFFIENIPKMGKPLIKEEQQRHYNIITGL